MALPTLCWKILFPSLQRFPHQQQVPRVTSGAALWFAVVLCCVLCGLTLLCK